MTNEMPAINSIAEFLFGAPLYAEFKISPAMVQQFYGIKELEKFDGFCPRCGKETTFTFHPQFVPQGILQTKIAERNSFDCAYLKCARNDAHEIRYWVWFRKGVLQKIGQYPSLADISNDDVAKYRSGMKKQDAQEFHKAIGLAAHGVGVGSFVYLRRVFERLIYSRFEEFRAAEHWDGDEFVKKRMSEKVEFLKGHLPDFLVENAKVYSILSVGIHELDEETCLAHFDAIKSSIILILEEDKKKREELAMKEKITAAIAGIKTKMEGPEKTEASELLLKPLTE